MKNFLLLLASAALLSSPAAAQGRRPPSSSGDIQLITRTINDCENRTDAFRKTLRRALNNSALDGSSREGQLNRSADRLERALDRVGDSWNRDKSISGTKQAVSEALSAGRDIHFTLRRSSYNSDVKRDWDVVRLQLNILASKFGLSQIR